MFLDDKTFHDLTELFPLMGKEEFDDLKNDIAKNGLLEPIWIDKEGLIIDGRNRYLACKELGVTPEYREFDGSGSLVSFVVSLNLRRRHLNKIQKAIIALNIEQELAEEAKKRQREAGRLYGRGQDEKLVPNLAQPISEKPHSKSRDQAAKVTGVSHGYVSDAKKISATAPDVIEAVMAGKIRTMPVATKIARLEADQRQSVLKKIDEGADPFDAIRETFRDDLRAKLSAVETIVAKEIEGVYDVIVIDPPWPAEQWIERRVAPKQAGLNYPTMSLDEIKDLDIPCASDCHVWLWTTQKFLHDAFHLIGSWELKHICTFVWVKPGGFQPFGLPQYDCEFVLYARKGSPKILDAKDFRTVLAAPRTEHSEKPEEFYDMVRRVTAGRRLDMFNRRQIEGFDGWGKETGTDHVA